MKILHVHDIGYSFGGAEIIVFSLIEAQRERGHDVRVLTSFDSRNTFATDTYTSNEKTMWDKCISYTWNTEARCVAKKLFETFQPDMIHIHSITKTSPSILSVFGTTPIVMTIHNFGIIDPTRIDLPSLSEYGSNLGDYFVFHKLSPRWFIERFRHAYIIRRLLRRVSLFLPSSRFMQSVIHEYEPTWKSRVVHLGIPLYKSYPLSRSVVFLGIGRFVQEKGFDHLIEAFSRVLHEIPEARLLLVGDGNESARIKHLITQRKITKSVRCIPQCDDRLLIEDYYKQTLIVVMPSLWPEPFGLVGIEACSVGRPVIAYDVGGVREWLRDGVNGALVRRGNIYELSEQMIELVKNPIKLHAMYRACIQASKEFSLDAYVQRLEDVYSDVLAGENNSKCV